MPIRPENKDRYPPEWAQIRERILERAGHACEWCGARNHEPHPRTGSHVVLTIAHVVDKRPEAADDDNLAALCQRCHLRHDMKGRRIVSPAPDAPAQITLTGRNG
jgi:5-methylcytosine-specific restriction endonuclease McrA